MYVARHGRLTDLDNKLTTAREHHARIADRVDQQGGLTFQLVDVARLGQGYLPEVDIQSTDVWIRKRFIPRAEATGLAEADQDVADRFLSSRFYGEFLVNRTVESF